MRMQMICSMNQCTDDSMNQSRQCFLFSWNNFENGAQFRDLEESLDALLEVGEEKFPAVELAEKLDEDGDGAAVHVGDLGKIQDDFFGGEFRQETEQRGAQLRAVIEIDFAGDGGDEGVAFFAGGGDE